MRVTFLGTGTSHGIPMIGCSCSVCTSKQVKNTRYRSSLLIEDDTAETRVVIDTGPEFRLQALQYAIDRLDAVFYTHDHADHLNGLDDLRVFSWHAPLAVYGNFLTLESIQSRFPYIFHGPKFGGGIPDLTLHTMPAESVAIKQLLIQAVPIQHGCRTILGYRIGNLAYLTDCSGISDQSYALLEGVEVVIIGALRFTPHPTHFSVDQAVAAARKIGAAKTYITHICHDMDHEKLASYLPAGMEPAYDGLVLEIPGGYS